MDLLSTEAAGAVGLWVTCPGNLLSYVNISHLSSEWGACPTPALFPKPCCGPIVTS